MAIREDDCFGRLCVRVYVCGQAVLQNGPNFSIISTLSDMKMAAGKEYELTRQLSTMLREFSSTSSSYFFSFFFFSFMEAVCVMG